MTTTARHVRLRATPPAAPDGASLQPQPLLLLPGAAPASAGAVPPSDGIVVGPPPSAPDEPPSAPDVPPSQLLPVLPASACAARSFSISVGHREARLLEDARIAS